MHSALQYRDPRRSRRGSLLAEMPAGLYFLFIGIAFPMLIMCTIFLRVFLLYQTTVDSCKQASRSSTFTKAQTTATAVFNQGKNAWGGISGTPTLSIMIRNLTTNSTSVSTTKLASGSVDISKNLYLARVVVAGQVEPLVKFPGSWQGLSIPGLTAAIPLTMTHVQYFENPPGLES